MSHLGRRVTTVCFAFVLAVMSVNLSGVLSLQNAFASNNGTLKVHEQGTPSNTESNDPKVCVFNFEGFFFDAAQSGTITIDGQGQTTGTNILSIPLAVGANGYGQTDPNNYINAPGSRYQLDEGHYKATFASSEGDKTKVFKVLCADRPRFVDECGIANDRIIVPATTGNAYFSVNGVSVDNKGTTLTGSGAATVEYHQKIRGADTVIETWQHTFSSEPCRQTVPTQAPTVTHDECGTINDTFNVPVVTGIVYKIGNTVVSGANIPTNGANSITINAYPASANYILSGDTQWTLTFPNSAACPTPAKPSVSVEPKLCSNKDRQNGTATVTVTNTADSTHAAATYAYTVSQGATIVKSGTTSSILDGSTDTINLTGLAAGDYTITINGTGNDTTSASTTFTIKECVTPTEPTWNDICLAKGADTFVIPQVTGTTYYVKTIFGYKPVSAGPHIAIGTVTVKAVAENGTTYGPWSHTFTLKPCSAPIETEPSMHEGGCGVVGDFYTIPTTEHITYKKLVGYFLSIPIYQTIAAGEYPGTGPITIIAVPDLGYVVNGKRTWTFEFDSTPCKKPVTPVKPHKKDKCGTENDFYKIIATEGVIYKVNGAPVTGKNFVNNASTVTITAEAAEGYELTDTKSEWTFRFTDKACPVVCPDPSTVDANQIRALTYATKIQNVADNCEPGQGGAGGETPGNPEQPKTPEQTKAPETPATVTELPQTGPETGDTFAKFALIVAAGITTYGAVFFAVNRRELLNK